MKERTPSNKRPWFLGADIQDTLAYLGERKRGYSIRDVLEDDKLDIHDKLLEEEDDKRDDSHQREDTVQQDSRKQDN